MQRLEVSGAVRLIYLYKSLGVKGLKGWTAGSDNFMIFISYL